MKAFYHGFLDAFGCIESRPRPMPWDGQAPDPKQLTYSEAKIKARVPVLNEALKTISQDIKERKPEKATKGQRKARRVIHQALDECSQALNQDRIESQAWCRIFWDHDHGAPAASLQREVLHAKQEGVLGKLKRERAEYELEQAFFWL